MKLIIGMVANFLKVQYSIKKRKYQYVKVMSVESFSLALFIISLIKDLCVGNLTMLRILF